MAFSISTLVETHQGVSLIQLMDLGVGRSRVSQSVQTSVPCLSELLSNKQSGGGGGGGGGFKCLVEGVHVLTTA